MLQLFIFDRAGACVATPVDIVEQPRRFLRFVIGLLVLDDARLGYCSPDNSETFTITFDQTLFIVDRKPVVVPQFDHLVSRATTCWRSKWADPKQRPDDWDPREEWPLILKSSWQYVTRDEEGKWLAELDEPGEPPVVAYRKGLVTVDGATTEYTSDFARGGFAMGAAHNFGSSKRHGLGVKRSLEMAPPSASGDDPLRSSSKAKAQRAFIWALHELLWALLEMLRALQQGTIQISTMLKDI
jgi:hypothetical protein